MPSGIVIEIIGIVLIVALMALVFWLLSPPLSINAMFIGVDNTTFIYVVSITPYDTAYWSSHSFDTVYNITAYTGNITVNCLTKPRLPFTVVVNNSTLYVTLLCPIAVTSVGVNTTGGVVSVALPQSPN